MMIQIFWIILHHELYISLVEIWRVHVVIFFLIKINTSLIHKSVIIYHHVKKNDLEPEIGAYIAPFGPVVP